MQQVLKLYDIKHLWCTRQCNKVFLMHSFVSRIFCFLLGFSVMMLYLLLDKVSGEVIAQSHFSNDFWSQ